MKITSCFAGIFLTATLAGCGAAPDTGSEAQGSEGNEEETAATSSAAKCLTCDGDPQSTPSTPPTPVDKYRIHITSLSGTFTCDNYDSVGEFYWNIHVADWLETPISIRYSNAYLSGVYDLLTNYTVDYSVVQGQSFTVVASVWDKDDAFNGGDDSAGTMSQVISPNMFTERRTVSFTHWMTGDYDWRMDKLCSSSLRWEVTKL